MAILYIGVHELEAQIGMYLERVQAGTTLIITDRGKPVGRIVPMGNSLETRVQELAQAGLVTWSGRKLTHRSPIARARSDRTVAELLIESRR